MSSYFTLRLDKVLYLLFFLAFFIGIGLLLSSDIFRVKRVLCRTQYGPCDEKVEEALEVFSGEHILLLNLEEVEKTAKTFFKIREAFVRKVLPETLVVSLEERKARVGLISSSGLFLVDQEGFILEKKDQTLLPRLKVENKEISVGGKINSTISSAVVLLDVLARSGLIVDAEFTEDFISTRIENASVLLPLNQDPRVTVGSLQLILARAKIEGRLLKLVDLRFKNPVVIFD